MLNQMNELVEDTAEVIEEHPEVLIAGAVVITSAVIFKYRKAIADDIKAFKAKRLLKKLREPSTVVDDDDLIIEINNPIATIK